MVDIDAMAALSEAATVRAEMAQSRGEAAHARVQRRAADLQRSRAVKRLHVLPVHRSATMGAPARAGLEWHVTRSPRAVEVRLSGELDFAADRVLTALRHELLAAAPARVVIDLRELRFLEMTGLRWLLSLQEALPCLELIRGRECVHAVFRLTGLDGRFTFAGADDRAPTELAMA